MNRQALQPNSEAGKLPISRKAVIIPAAVSSDNIAIFHHTRE
jgi:hypothetical protein